MKTLKELRSKKELLEGAIKYDAKMLSLKYEEYNGMKTRREYAIKEINTIDDNMIKYNSDIKELEKNILENIEEKSRITIAIAQAESE